MTEPRQSGDEKVWKRRRLFAAGAAIESRLRVVGPQGLCRPCTIPTTRKMPAPTSTSTRSFLECATSCVSTQHGQRRCDVPWTAADTIGTREPTVFQRLEVLKYLAREAMPFPTMPPVKSASFVN